MAQRATSLVWLPLSWKGLDIALCSTESKLEGIAPAADTSVNRESYRSTVYGDTVIERPVLWPHDLNNDPMTVNATMKCSSRGGRQHARRQY
jgi:hypothetical protein